VNTLIHRKSLHGLSLVYSASLSLTVLRQAQDKPFDRLRINSTAIRYATQRRSPIMPYPGYEIQGEALCIIPYGIPKGLNVRVPRIYFL